LENPNSFEFQIPITPFYRRCCDDDCRNCKNLGPHQYRADRLWKIKFDFEIDTATADAEENKQNTKINNLKKEITNLQTEMASATTAFEEKKTKKDTELKTWKERNTEMQNLMRKLPLSESSIDKAENEETKLKCEKEKLEDILFKFPLIQFQSGKEFKQHVNVGVIGPTRTGKSTFMNTIRDFEYLSEEEVPENLKHLWAKTSDNVETTKIQNGYPSMNGKKYVLWDLPGHGTDLFPSSGYMRNMGLTHFDILILFTTENFSVVDMEILMNTTDSKGEPIPVLLVKNKIDESCEKEIDQKFMENGEKYAVDIMQEIFKTKNKNNLTESQKKFLQEYEKIKTGFANDFNIKGKIYFISSYPWARHLFDIPELERELHKLIDEKLKEKELS